MTLAGVAQGGSSLAWTGPWPEACGFTLASAEVLPRQKSSVGLSGTEAQCQLMAQATGWLLRDVSQTRVLLGEIRQPLSLTQEFDWLRGRVALAEGDAAAAIALLRGEGSGFPTEAFALWDLAVASAVLGSNDVAREAYRRLLGQPPFHGRAMLAVVLELAVVESRIGPEGIDSARLLLRTIAAEELDPDTCPWVAGLQLLLLRLDPLGSGRPRWDCSRPRGWQRALDDHSSLARLFAEVPRSSEWLRVPRNERLALVALGLGRTSSLWPARLWNAVEVPPATALGRLKLDELAASSRQR